jgi:large subunit ribosomal protein L15
VGLPVADLALALRTHAQVSACDEESRAAIEEAGGRVTRVYFTEEGLQAHLSVSREI